MFMCACVCASYRVCVHAQACVLIRISCGAIACYHNYASSHFFSVTTFFATPGLSRGVRAVVCLPALIRPTIKRNFNTWCQKRDIPTNSAMTNVMELPPLQIGDPGLLKLDVEKEISQPSTVVRRELMRELSYHRMT